MKLSTVWGPSPGLDAEMRAGLLESKDLQCIPTVDDVRSYSRLEHRGRETDEKDRR
jgi:hypothetical protein